MQTCDLIHDRQAKSCARLATACAIQAAERLQGAANLLRWNAGATIQHGKKNVLINTDAARLWMQLAFKNNFRLETEE